MMSITQPRSIPAGSRPCADDRARVLRHPYTAMKEPAWASRMPRAGASRPAAMRLPRVRIRARQPHGVTNPQPGGPAGAPPAGPTPKRSLNPSTQATVNAVPGRAWPRKKADAAVNIPFTRPNRAASAREPLNSAIASPADCLVSAATAAPVLSLQRRSVSGATPGSPAT